jgi:hypothetical protein
MEACKPNDWPNRKETDYSLNDGKISVKEKIIYRKSFLERHSEPWTVKSRLEVCYFEGVIVYALLIMIVVHDYGEWQWSIRLSILSCLQSNTCIRIDWQLNIQYPCIFLIQLMGLKGYSLADTHFFNNSYC